jgi:alpha-tubulin suppressor-like RCC1 family protein
VGIYVLASHRCVALLPALMLFGCGARTGLAELDLSSTTTGASGSSRASAVSAGYYHTYAVTLGGGVECWGDNNVCDPADVIGNYLSLVPGDINGPSSGVRAISSGRGHTCVLTLAGGVKCWGSGGGVDSSVPIDVVGLNEGVSAVAAGAYHTCALTSTGGVKCWGDNELGTLGNNSEVNSSVPVDVTGLTEGVAAVSAGTVMTCALTLTGRVKCWGDNQQNELGNDSTVHSDVPVDVVGLEGVRAISCGDSTTCAVTSVRGLKCWGFNIGGQACSNASTCPIPTDVAGLTSNVLAVSVGGGSACVLTVGGGVKCWGGFGSNGGNPVHLPNPVDVAGMESGVVAVSAGWTYACVLTLAGSVKCWGDNEYGQLGNGSTNDSQVPVDVVGL